VVQLYCVEFNVLLVDSRVSSASLSPGPTTREHEESHGIHPRPPPPGKMTYLDAQLPLLGGFCRNLQPPSSVCAKKKSCLSIQITLFFCVAGEIVGYKMGFGW
jgi:hypothetical protein